MRGDFVTIATQGDFGKSRPALVIQSDLFHEQPTLTVLPVTGTLVSAPWRYSLALQNKALLIIRRANQFSTRPLAFNRLRLNPKGCNTCNKGGRILAFRVRRHTPAMKQVQ